MRLKHGLALFLVLTAAAGVGVADGKSWRLTLRSQKETAPGRGQFRAAHRAVEWDPRKTALIICDMWDRHWCRGATERVAEMAPAMNEAVRSARARGVLIIHAPSETMAFYEDTPPRRRAREAPKVTPPTAPPEGAAVKPPLLPIDDSDGGCDTGEKPWHRAWTRQHPALEVAAEDAITDRGEEVYNLLRARGIENVLIMGVHTNMCVLNRPFAIRRLVALGQNVALVRDLTDAMYNPQRPPHVDHFRGTDRVVEHIERHWCPTVASTDLTGRPAFRFRDDRRAP